MANPFENSTSEESLAYMPIGSTSDPVYMEYAQNMFSNFDDRQKAYQAEMAVAFSRLPIHGRIVLAIVIQGWDFVKAKNDNASAKDIHEACKSILHTGGKIEGQLGAIGELFLSQWNTRIRKLTAIEKSQTLEGFKAVVQALEFPPRAPQPQDKDYASKHMMELIEQANAQKLDVEGMNRLMRSSGLGPYMSKGGVDGTVVYPAMRLGDDSLVSAPSFFFTAASAAEWWEEHSKSSNKK